jgi:hypothetical protein
LIEPLRLLNLEHFDFRFVITLLLRNNQMHNHAKQKHLSPFLRGLSIAIVCGVAALNPNGAHAFPEHLVLALGQYTIYQSGVSDQVPVSVKLNWTKQDQLNMTYTAYDNSNNQILSTNFTTPLEMPLSTFQDNPSVPAGTVPVRFYAEAQGVSGGDDQMQETQINNYTYCDADGTRSGAPVHSAPGPFTLGPVVDGVDQNNYRVLIGAVSPNAQGVQLNYTWTDGNANIHFDTKPTSDNPSLTANQLWLSNVAIPVGTNFPVYFNVQVNGVTTLTYTYQLGKKNVKNVINDLTLIQGPTLHFGDWKVPIDSHVKLTQNANVSHSHMKVFFTARDEGGHTLDCDPAVVKELTYNPANQTWNGPASVTVRDPDVVHGRVTLTAILALYDNGTGLHVPPSFVEPSTKIKFGGT